ncbi:hypothetical protein RI129_003455 [Pyrocoelia pectoralis]|uniref:YqaJ viral recombinase domain-containing protein n=1 Tax=Pyrocoelia pectoralis TaxID=417401 RepID=A0AAN7ZV34_9COLE
MVDAGYLKGMSHNLPRVDVFMLAEFLKKDDRFNAAEIREAKAEMASRENYGDNAIGYVQLRREGGVCFLKGKICPEHKVRNKGYSVTIEIDEREEMIKDIQCGGCAAASGGCKHALAFLMWVHRRSEEPSPTEVECYWKKSKLAKVGTSIKFIEASACTNRKPQTPKLPDTTSLLTKFMDVAKQKELTCQITRHNNYSLANDSFGTLSIYQLVVSFYEEGGEIPEDFLNFCIKTICPTIRSDAECATLNQHREALWWELRYGRITASKVYEAVHCHTGDGSLIKQIIGTSKVRDTNPMKRETELAVPLNKCGIYIVEDYPVCAASPDAISADFTVEIKCPASEKAMKNYIKNNIIAPKFKAQIQLQMYATKKTKALFCVADPDFENNNKTYKIWEDIDVKFCEDLLNKAVVFWCKYVFPKILQSVKQ